MNTRKIDLASILAGLERLEAGNFGDAKFLRNGVGELRIDWEPGNQVYFGRDRRMVIVLLCGGHKRKRYADIRKAVEISLEFENRRKSGPRSKN